MLKEWFLRWIGFQNVKEIRIKRSVLDDLCEMAKNAHPKEMLAFLSATGGNKGGVVVIDEIQLQAYDASTHSASFQFYLLPTFTSIIGTVHSHPSKDRRPSDEDVHLFGQYGLVHGIIGYPYRTDSITFYDKQGEAIDVQTVD